MWFKNLQEADDGSDSGLGILAKALTEAVIYCHVCFPPTLILDRNRLRKLQHDFQVLIYQAACRRTLKRTLKSLGWKDKGLSRSDTDGLFATVIALISDPGLRYDYWQRMDSVAIEVVRAAYAIYTKDRDLPTSKDLRFAEGRLRHYCDPNKPVSEVMRSALTKQLIDEVNDVLRETVDLTPVQLMRRLLPLERGFAVQSEFAGLIHVAARISHIAELHWRVWGPILYEQPLRARSRALLGARSSAARSTSLINEPSHDLKSSHSDETISRAPLRARSRASRSTSLINEPSHDLKSSHSDESISRALRSTSLINERSDDLDRSHSNESIESGELRNHPVS